VAFTLEVADQGFPLTSGCLEDHVNRIVCTSHGDEFPGVGVSWASHFAEHHSDALHKAYSRKLDTVWAQGVIPTNHHLWFDLLKKELEGVEPDCIYGIDETGIQVSKII
jgi:hypothetical protein